MSNLLLHRDYSYYKESVYSKIVIYKDRVEFRNVGSLYGENTIEKIKKPEINIEVRNKTMVRLIEVLGGVLENRHTGIKTMIDEMKHANLPEPVFKNEREDFVVEFYNGEYPELQYNELTNGNFNQKEPKKDSKRTQEKNKKNPRRTQEESKKNSKRTQEKNNINSKQMLEIDIINFCNTPRTAMEICEKFGFKSIKTFKRNYLKSLVNKKLLVMTIPDKPTSKNQKYISVNK